MKGSGASPSGDKSRKTRRMLISRKRIYFVDQFTILRTALGGFINAEPGLQFCGGEARPAYALEAIARLKPDLVVVGSPLGAPGSIRFIEQLRRHFPSMAIIAYSLYNDPFYVDRAIRAGASAYIAKETGSDHLLQVIRTLLFSPADNRQPDLMIPTPPRGPGEQPPLAEIRP